MKKITLFIMFVISCLYMNAQTTNLTGLTGEDLIFFEDTRFFKAFGDASPGASGITVKSITAPSNLPGGVTLNAANQIVEGTGVNLSNFVYPTATYPVAGAVGNGSENGGGTAVAVRVQGNTGSANDDSDVWIVVNSVDLSSYDGGSKYFTFHARSSFYENGADKTDDSITIAYTTNFTTGTDPELATWTEIDMNTVTTVGSSDDLGADGKWTTNQIDLSSITCGDKFAMRIRRVTSANGPNGSGVYVGGTNRNGTFNFTNPTFTGTPLKIDVIDGDFSALNTSSTGQTSIFNTPTSSIADANFSNTSKWAAIFDAGDTSVPRLANGTLIPVDEGYKFEVASGYNPIVVTEMRFRLANAALTVPTAKGQTGGVDARSYWKVQGSNDDSIWDDLCDPIGMYSSNTVPNTGTVKLRTTKAYRYYRFVLATEWTPTQNFTSLQQLDFTVAALWTGASSNWSTASNWNTKAVPTNEVVIPSGLSNYPTIATGTTVATNNIRIESGATLIAEGTSTVAGTVTYKRNLSFTAGGTNGWHLVGSPVTGQAYNDDYVTDNSIASGTLLDNKGIAIYDNTVGANNWVYLQGGASGNFDKATGYSVKTSKTTDISFTGTLNTTDPVDVTISTGAGTAFNLISNPFTSYVNAKTFLELAANSTKLTSQTIWIWNPGTKDYDAKLSGDVTPFQIAPGQGFFVSSSFAEGASGDLTFVESNQSHQGTDTFLKSSSKPEIQLNITNGELNRYVKIRYNNNATKSFDNGYDGKVFGGVANSFELYTQLLENNVGKKYQIQSIPNQDLESMIIPVGLKAVAGQLTFSAEALNLPSGLKVYLEDRSTGSFTRLDESNSSYKITLEENLNGAGRFYLHTAQKSLSVDTNAVLESVSMYKTDNATLRIVGLEQGTANIKVFNILGKQVLNSSFKSSGSKDISLPKLATGVYVVQLTTKAGKLNKKIILE